MSTLDYCERVIPTVVQTRGGRFVAAYHVPCRQPVFMDDIHILPASPSEPSFAVSLCSAHTAEAMNLGDATESSDESPGNYCTDCKSYTHPATGSCGC